MRPGESTISRTNSAQSAGVQGRWFWHPGSSHSLVYGPRCDLHSILAPDTRELHRPATGRCIHSSDGLVQSSQLPPRPPNAGSALASSSLLFSTPGMYKMQVANPTNRAKHVTVILACSGWLPHSSAYLVPNGRSSPVSSWETRIETHTHPSRRRCSADRLPHDQNLAACSLSYFVGINLYMHWVSSIPTTVHT